MSQHMNTKPILLRFLALFLLVFPFWSIGHSNLVETTISDSQSTIEVINLDVSNDISCTNRLTAFTIQKAFFPLSITNQELFAIFTVSNSGQVLKKISITVNVDDYEWVQTYNRVENSRDIYYDFSLETELVIPLTGTPTWNDITIFHASFSLEYYPSITNIDASFSLLKSEIVQVRNLRSSEVIGIPSNFIVHVVPSEVLQHRKRYILTTYYRTNISQNSKLYVTLSLDTPLQIETLNLIGTSLTSKYDDIRTSHRVEIILERNLTKVQFQLELAEGLVESIVEINIHIDNVILTSQDPNLRNGLFNELHLPPHPIPEEIMFVVLITVLFGIPTYLVYKHQELEAKKRLNILKE